jgi:tetratricopeptide (TPR) repeat protein
MSNHKIMTAGCCAECGKEEGEGGAVTLKMCKACMSVKYCNAKCQKNHWSTHKKECKLRAAEIRDEALFKDPPPKEECPICFLPMPDLLISCVSLPPATIFSVPIYDFAEANEGLKKTMDAYYPCCGKSICKGCDYSFDQSGNDNKCPFCNADQCKTDEEMADQIMKRVEANDPASIYMLANSYERGLHGVQQDCTKAIELYAKAANLGHSDARWNLANIYRQGGDLKKAKFHCEAAAMAGHEIARCSLGIVEANSGNMEQAIKHWTIAASAGNYTAMHHLRIGFEEGAISRKSMDSILAAYNNSCAEMRSEARDAYIRSMTE